MLVKYIISMTLTMSLLIAGQKYEQLPDNDILNYGCVASVLNQEPISPRTAVAKGGFFTIKLRINPYQALITTISNNFTIKFKYDNTKTLEGQTMDIYTGNVEQDILKLYVPIDKNGKIKRNDAGSYMISLLIKGTDMRSTIGYSCVD